METEVAQPEVSTEEATIAATTSRLKPTARLHTQSFLCQGGTNEFRCFSVDLGACLYGAGPPPKGGYVSVREYKNLNAAGFCVGKPTTG